MTFTKSAALTAGFLGAFGIGVWSSPYLTHRDAPETQAAFDASSVPPAPATAVEHQPIAQPTAKAVRAVAVSSIESGATEFHSLNTSVAIGTPELQQRLKPLLKSGADMDVAAEGFRSAEQFATVAHAAQNTEVPFMLLKHRVLNEGDTLVAAIRKSKPDVDAVVEVDRARAEARSDLSSLD